MRISLRGMTGLRNGWCAISVLAGVSWDGAADGRRRRGGRQRTRRRNTGRSGKRTVPPVILAPRVRGGPRQRGCHREASSTRGRNSPGARPGIRMGHALFLAIGVRQASTLPRRLRNERCRHVLDRFAAALGARRMGRRVFREMFRVVENLTALLATILIGGHDAPPTCMVQGLAAAGLPATSGNLGFHSRTPCRARHGLSFRMTGTASGTPASHRAPCVLIMETCACLLAA